MRFLIVSFTDLTFLPSEMRDVVGDLTTSLYIASCSLFCGKKKQSGQVRGGKKQDEGGQVRSTRNHRAKRDHKDNGGH